MEITKLENIAEVSAGQGAPQGDNNYDDNGLPFIKAGNLEDLIITKDEYKSCKLVNRNTAKKHKLKLYPKDTIVFAKSGMSATKGRIYCLNNEAYVVNHLSTIIPNTKLIESKYLKYFFYVFSPARLIKDEAYPSISLGDIKHIQIPLRSLEEQKNIINILDVADSLRQRRKQALYFLDDYLKSVFLEMFGDPMKNPKNIKKVKIKDMGNVFTGNTPSRNKPENYGSLIEWIKSDNINNDNHYLTKATEFISKIGYKKARVVPAGSVLVTCIAGSLSCIGNVGMTDREVAFNQQINAIVPSSGVEQIFLYAQILFSVHPETPIFEVGSPFAIGPIPDSLRILPFRLQVSVIGLVFLNSGHTIPMVINPVTVCIKPRPI